MEFNTHKSDSCEPMFVDNQFTDKAVAIMSEWAIQRAEQFFREIRDAKPSA